MSGVGAGAWVLKWGGECGGSDSIARSESFQKEDDVGVGAWWEGVAFREKGMQGAAS